VIFCKEEDDDGIPLLKKSLTDDGRERVTEE